MNDNVTNNDNPQKDRSSQIAIIGKTLQFDGNIKGDEDLIVEGVVEGTISLKDAALTIANGGLVRGDIFARTILIEGEVRGELRGTEVVEISPKGVVYGDVRAPRVMLQDGCQFKGLVDMDHKEAVSSAERKRPPQPVSPMTKKNIDNRTSATSLPKMPPNVPSLSVKS